MLVDSPHVLLAQPYAAAALGALLGVGFLFASRASFRAVTAEDPARGVLVAGLLMLGRLFLSVLALWAYKTVAPGAFLYFALALGAGFVVTYTVELVRFAGLHRYARPSRVQG